MLAREFIELLSISDASIIDLSTPLERRVKEEAARTRIKILSCAQK